MKNFSDFIKKNYLYIVFILVLISVFGSLYFSEVEKFIPCPLCWWQRVAMFPLLPIVAIGLIVKDKFTKYYVIALSSLGALVSIYQNLLQGTDIFPKEVGCSVSGVSCAVPTIVLEIATLQISLEFLALLGLLGILFLTLLGTLLEDLDL